MWYLFSRCQRMKVESAIRSPSSSMYGSLPFGARRKPVLSIRVGQGGLAAETPLD
jgi:hypothetical protein